MFAAIIDNGNTWLLDIRDNIEISLDDLQREWDKRYVGWLVNTDSMPEIIRGIPVIRFILKVPDKGLEDISVAMAHQIYQALIDLRKGNPKR